MSSEVGTNELICNFKKCRKRITDVAYVTACCHVFCDEDGTREFNKSTACPACNTELSAKFEIVRNQLHPSHKYKSMILAGLRPEIIIEIFSRAISFWEYQISQEKTYQEFLANKSKERATQLEQYYEGIVNKTNNELKSLRQQLADAKKENEETKQKICEISEQLFERSRQHQNLQAIYEKLRRKFMMISSVESINGLSTPLPPLAHNTVMSSGDAIHANIPANMARHEPSHKPDFHFKPNLSNDLPANQIQDRFSVDPCTPRK